MIGLIEFQKEPYDANKIIDSLHPFVKEWFFMRFDGFSPPQRFSILNIKNRINTLISSPTGSGKTLSAFLAVIDDLVMKADKGILEDKVYAIYISPLKALANDINRNLNNPLKEITAIAKKYGRKLDIRVATRTGDTTPSQKNTMIKKPPHILITTPESLAISLATTKFSELISEAEFLIVDEIHSLAENKRGTHLSLTIECLDYNKEIRTGSRMVRVGLSATVRPLKEVANFLVGNINGEPKPCKVIDVQMLKELDLKVLSPVSDLINSSYNKTQRALYEMINGLIQKHRTTLIFTNTRSGTERVVHNLKERFPNNYVGVIDENNGLSVKKRGLIGAHHGSLSKSHRLNIEQMLKKGKLKTVVCSTSLELGIDIGYIDLVILLGSPKGVARALQRVGRSGHKLHEKARGRIIVFDRDDLVECSVLLRSALEKRIDLIRIPKCPLDVLAQQIFGFAVSKKWRVNELYNMIICSYPYKGLKRKDYDAVISYLAGEYASLEKRSVYAKIWYDRREGMIGRRGRLARLIYMTNIGTIPDETNIKVKMGDLVLGTINEGFLERLKPGDVFVLGGETYEFRYSRGLTVQVRTALGKPPTVPRWVSEMLPLSFELALEISKFRRYISQLFENKSPKESIIKYIDDYLYIDKNSSEAIYEFFKEQWLFSKIPHDKKIVIEYFNEGNKRCAVFHTLYGRRVNDVLSRAAAYIQSKITGRDVQIGITDNGFFLRSSLPIRGKTIMKNMSELRKIMNIAIEKTEVLRMRFRHCAARSLMILRNYKGDFKSVGKQQMSSRLLLNSVRAISKEFPILKEARREVLEDLMDIKNAELVVSEITAGEVVIEEVIKNMPGPFAFNIVLDSYTDLLKIEDRVEFIKRMHNMLINNINKKNVSDKASWSLTPEISYHNLWNKQDEIRRLKEEDFKSYLHELFRFGAKKSNLSADLRDEGHRFIEGEKPREEFLSWVESILSGDVPKLWHDDLVKFWFERLRN